MSALAFVGGWFTRAKSRWNPTYGGHIRIDPPLRWWWRISKRIVVDEAQKARLKISSRTPGIQNRHRYSCALPLHVETWNRLEAVNSQGLKITGDARILSDPVERKLCSQYTLTLYRFRWSPWSSKVWDRCAVVLYRGLCCWWCFSRSAAVKTLQWISKSSGYISPTVNDWGTVDDGKYFCYTLEDRVRAKGVKIPKETAIPYAIYTSDWLERKIQSMSHIF